VLEEVSTFDSFSALELVSTFDEISASDVVVSSALWLVVVVTVVCFREKGRLRLIRFSEEIATFDEVSTFDTFSTFELLFTFEEISVLSELVVIVVVTVSEEISTSDKVLISFTLDEISASDPITSSELELWKDTDSVLTTGISIVMMLILSIFSFSSVTVSVFDPVLTLDWTTASPSIMEVVIVVTSSESDSVVGLAVD